MRSKLENGRGKNVPPPHKDLNKATLELKPSMLSMSYTDPVLLMIVI